MNPALPQRDKAISRAVPGGRTRRWQDEYDSAREDALFYRDQTIGIVRHFFEIASQVGRLPSIMGREFFRAKVSHRGIPSFEDQVVFVHDVEGCLARLPEDEAEILALVGLFQHKLDAAAKMLGQTRAWAVGRYANAVDDLATLFLEAGILKANRVDRRIRYFSVREDYGKLPPKKPVQSVPANEYHTVGAANAGRSFGGSRSEA